MQHVLHDTDGDIERHVLAPLAGLNAAQRAQRFAVHVLEHEQDVALRCDDVDRGHDVRIPDTRGQARFLEQHLREVVVLNEVRQEPLDGDHA